MSDISARTFLNRWKMCATCRRVLEKKTMFTGAVIWQHPSDMIKDEDHPPVPVDLDETVDEKCDVCFADGPSWVLPARDFQWHPKMPISTGNWALCDECVVIVRQRNWDALYRRAVTSYEARHGDLTQPGRELLSQMYKMLRENVTGEVRRA
jgi:hypothetical protein